MIKEKLKCSNPEDEEEFNIITTQSIYYGVAGNETKETDLNYWTVIIGLPFFFFFFC